MVRSLVELHGGSVKLKSEGLGGGSKFTICLPRLATNSVELPIGLETQGLPIACSLRIMVDDDNEDAARMLAVLLEFKGHQVAVEHDPYRILQQATAETFDAPARYQAALHR